MIINPQFRPFQLDILKEFANIGAGHAATSLSTMIGEKVSMDVPKIHITTFNEAVQLLGGADVVANCIFLPFTGDIQGNFLILSRKGEIDNILEKIFLSLQVENITNELLESANSELGNILGSSYLNAISDFTGLSISVGIPFVTTDLTGALLMEALAHLVIITDNAVIIDTVISEGEYKKKKLFEGHVLFLPTFESYSALFESIGFDEI